MTATQAPAIEVPGFTDSHTHLLTDSAGPRSRGTARGWPSSTAGWPARAARRWTCRMPRPPERGMTSRPGSGPACRRGRGAGLVEITEMGIRHWWYLDALARLQAPDRCRCGCGSTWPAAWPGRSSPAELARTAVRAAAWVALDGVKFYADGWLGPRTCAMCRDFADGSRGRPPVPDRGEHSPAGSGRSSRPGLADRDARYRRPRRSQTVLDGYELAWGGDLRRSPPRRRGSSTRACCPRELIAGWPQSGVVACIQPSFAVTDAPHAGRRARRRTGPRPLIRGPRSPPPDVRLLAGTDYPIEVLEPLVGLARLVSGQSAAARASTRRRPRLHAPGWPPPWHSRLMSAMPPPAARCCQPTRVRSRPRSTGSRCAAPSPPRSDAAAPAGYPDINKAGASGQRRRSASTGQLAPIS